MSNKQKLLEFGFVDVLSLVAVLFLVTTLIAVTTTITNRNTNLSFQEEAAYPPALPTTPSSSCGTVGQSSAEGCCLGMGDMGDGTCGIKGTRCSNGRTTKDGDLCNCQSPPAACKSTTPRNTPAPTQAPNIITQNDCNTCRQTNTVAECSVMCGSIGQTYATAVPKPIPSPPALSPKPSSAPSPKPNIITQADYTNCLQTNTLSECKGILQNIGQTYATATPKPQASQAPVLKTFGDTCTSGNECESGTCEGGTSRIIGAKKSCTAATVAENITSIALATGPFVAVFGGIMAAPVIAPIITQAAAAVGSAATLTYINATNTIAASPVLQTTVNVTQAAGNILPGVTAVTFCQLYGTNTPECQNAAGVAIPAAQISMTQQATQNLADQLSTKPVVLPSSGTIPIDQLNPHEPGYNVQTVDALTGIIKKGSTLDPVEITVYNNQIYTVNGANRVTATMQTGGSTVQYTLTPYKDLNPTLQTMVKQIDSGSSIFGRPIPSSYTNFTPAYNYRPTTIRP